MRFAIYSLLFGLTLLVTSCAVGPGGLVQNLSAGRIMSVRGAGGSEGADTLAKARVKYPPVDAILKKHGQPTHMLEDGTARERKVVLFYLPRGEGFLCVQQGPRYRVVGPTPLGPKTMQLLEAIDTLETSTQALAAGR